MTLKNKDYEYTKEDLDNHSNQMNINNDAYWQSRGEEERLDDWEDQANDFDNLDNDFLDSDDCGDDRSWD